ncbi:MAG: hypothetical protein COB53_01695 [Elusimicrobia bacterium]|nr:MAG: hypothetical protein COB53_01695 [Elusimicrobiota bacterium]
MPAILFLAILIGILACIFALQNTEVIAITFLLWKVEASLALVLLLTFALGAAMGILACAPALVKGKLSGRDPADPKAESKKDVGKIETSEEAKPPTKEEPPNP